MACGRKTLAFVTGNPKKLEEVNLETVTQCVDVWRVLVTGGGHPGRLAELGAHLKECRLLVFTTHHSARGLHTFLLSLSFSVPELQGEPEEIAMEKCRIAVEKVELWSGGCEESGYWSVCM